MHPLVTLHHGDCLAVLRSMPDNSVDSIVTDPPYGLRFMSKKWDYDVPSVEIWTECLRVLKPGGHLLSFAGTRTQHRMCCRIEDAGFEIRDMIAWVYGSGFPKSLDVSKAIDKAAGVTRETVGFDEKKLRPNRINRGLVNSAGGSGYHADNGATVTAPTTHEAKQWHGWGTALKPALEPITVARKPFKGTVAANVLAHGTGALNIDGCRVGMEGSRTNSSKPRAERNGFNKGFVDGTETIVRDQGRWPANLIHDGSDEVLSAFPEAKGQQGALTGNELSGEMGSANCYGKMDRRHESTPRIEDDKSAARFFYCAKISRKDRNEGLSDPGPQFQHGATLRKVENTATTGNNHPTVKPTELMAYLCRLVTPPGGVVLDPFMGSGSTGKAAMLEGFQFIGIERESEYVEIARARIAEAQKKADAA
ncbi:site-specific DNA-methyltransferase [Pectobacterium parmentieri]|uniref:DNA-methyltransferase n=1 Tax=Pectobacterium parmentieri TaxID=1905730 RepID=UPI000EABAD71|nr:DNA methyltransferase [Pectobacterium parmentieri]RKO74363.1 site-specific DNA-methyltransferase [Pectobacterium parmentieri]